MPATTTSPSLFISYRRADAGGWAGTLHRELVAQLGKERVFFDEHDIPPGEDFETRIESVLDACRAVIVVIGRDWATMRGPDGELRLAAGDDLLCREVAQALARPDVTVIPLRVGGAAMPAAEDLPAPIRGLARRHSPELTNANWVTQMPALVAELRRVLGGGGGGVVPPAPLVAVGAMLAAAVVGVLVSWLFTSGLAESRRFGAPAADRIVYFAAERAVIWGIVCALVLAAAAATLRRDRGGAPGYAIVGLGAGALGGALSGAAYMALKDNGVLTNEHVLRGLTAAIAGVVLAMIVARLVDGGRSIYMLAGLAGGLLGGILAQQLLWEPGSSRLISMTLFETVVVIGALAALATTASPAFAGRRRDAAGA